MSEKTSLRLKASRNLSHAGLLAFSLLTASTVRADLLVYASNSGTSPGGSGSFDLVLYNDPTTGLNTFQVGGFNTEVQVVSNSGVTFTTVSQKKADPYIFGDNPGAPTLVTSNFTSTDISVNDISLASPYYRELTPGQSVGLAHIQYTLNSSVPLSGPGSKITVSLNGVTISGADGTTPLPNISLKDGTISAVPEPGSLMLAGLLSGVGAVLVGHRRMCNAKQHSMPVTI